MKGEYIMMPGSNLMVGPGGRPMESLGAVAARRASRMRTKGVRTRTSARMGGGGCCDSCSCNCVSSGCCPDCVTSRMGARVDTGLMRIGADEANCEETPDDPVCKAFYAPTPTPQAAPVAPAQPGFFESIIAGGVKLLTPAPAKSPSAAASAAGASSGMSTQTMLLLGGGALAAIYFLGRKKR